MKTILKITTVIISLVTASYSILTFAGNKKNNNDIQFYHFDKMKYEQVSDKVFRRYVYGKDVMLVYWYFKKGAVIPMQRHVSEQITYILKGAVEVISGDKTYQVKAGDVIILPSNAPHKFIALEDTVDLDIFTPVRHDWFHKH